ncbi:GNAT family N-acetyltransferase [Radiobacillus kanasensis]|uniref:GNAT family N-acetyltransferase n=1 Tax=Radiobacillus kanasensis TaxID=2844358 RepID=UPI001E4E8382|nr:GNAT family N-acetyltransferase [Radiobacillus kanasensis]UFT98342.1 GNAT family N-acetyltransferase [Radiobacillus kanasensis]
MGNIQRGNEEESVYIRKKLIEYNMEKLTDEVKTPLEKVSFVIKNEKSETVGGITGTMFWHHLHIDFLWVSDEVRGKGYGSELIEHIEFFAKENNCRLLLLDTFSFQAPDFYQKLGFDVVGVVEDHPKGHSQYFLQKRLN